MQRSACCSPQVRRRSAMGGTSPPNGVFKSGESVIVPASRGFAVSFVVSVAKKTGSGIRLNQREGHVRKGAETCSILTASKSIMRCEQRKARLPEGQMSKQLKIGVISLSFFIVLVVVLG